MRVQRTRLDDGWQLSAVSVLPPEVASRMPASLRATVPGVVHTDLLAAGLIDDPYRDNREAELQWIGHADWQYSTQFDLPEGRNHHELLFEGLDTVATVTVNGKEVLRAANQHRTYRVDVTDVVLPTGNELQVRFDSAWAYAEEERERLGDRPNAYPSPFNFIRKMASNFGWDWGPQLVTAGVWKPASLVSWDSAHITRTRVVPSLIEGRGVVDIELGVQVEPQHSGCAEVTASVDGVTKKAMVVDGIALLRLEVEHPQLWWPRELGEPTRYGLHISLEVDGEQVDEEHRRIGFRHVELDTSVDADGSAFTLSVNGTPIFIKGANWIPDDCFPSRISSERYADRISQAVQANVNLLRVWGGGIYESDAFFELCDEAGVLVWQDFLFACAAYPEEQPHFDNVREEAIDNIVRLSSHPSLALWNGCNENIWGWFDWEWQEPLGDLTWGMRYYVELLPDLVAQLAPHVPYWPGSPYSGAPDTHANEPSRGNVHIWDAWNRADYTVYSTYRPRFVSEFGYQGPPAWTTLTSWISDRPLTEASPNMLVHQKADDGVGKIRRGMAPHLPEPRDIESWHYLAQLQQGRAVSYGIEHFRSLRPLCMGAIVWQFNDCWPAVSWAAVDGAGQRKPLWHALKRAYAPRLLRIERGEGSARVVLVNDSSATWNAEFEVRRIDATGSPLASVVLKASVESATVGVHPLSGAIVSPSNPTAEILVAVDSGGEIVATAHWVEARDSAFPPAGVDLEVGPWEDGAQCITLASSRVLLGLIVFADRVESGAWVSDSDITIVPGLPVVLELHASRAFSVDELRAPGVLRWLNEPQGASGGP